MDCRDVADGMGVASIRKLGSSAGLIAQVAADRHVAMGDVAARTEKEIDDREDRVQPAAKPGRGRRVEIHLQLAQPIPRPLDPLLDVGVGGEQRAGDLRGAETAEHPQASMATRDSAGTASWQQTKSEADRRFVADLVGEMQRLGRR